MNRIELIIKARRWIIYKAHNLSTAYLNQQHHHGSLFFSAPRKIDMETHLKEEGKKSELVKEENNMRNVQILKSNERKSDTSFYAD